MFSQNRNDKEVKPWTNHIVTRGDNDSVSAVSQLLGRVAPGGSMDTWTHKDEVKGGRCVPTEDPLMLKSVPAGSMSRVYVGDGENIPE
jgi:hypothetical protein